MATSEIPIIPETESSSLGLESIFGSEFRVLLLTETSSSLTNINTNISFLLFSLCFSMVLFKLYFTFHFLFVGREKMIYNVFIFLDISGCLKFHGRFRGTLGCMRSHTSELQSPTSQQNTPTPFPSLLSGISSVIKLACVEISMRDHA